MAAEKAKEKLAEYQPLYTRYYEQGMREKLGLMAPHLADPGLFENLFSAMESQVDFTRFFRALSEFDPSGENHFLRDQFIERMRIDQWADAYRTRLTEENSDPAERQQRMHRVNPKYILRNYLAQSAIVKAENDAFSEIDTLLSLLTKPYDEQPEMESYADEPPDWARTLELSCSS